MVTILHISDLHFTRDAAAHIMREVLRREARERVHDKPRGQKLLVVTGDFHNFWAPDYRDATKFMGELVEAMDIDPAEDVFIVPGNHDVGDDKVLGPVLKDAIPDWSMHKTAALTMIDSGNYGFLGWRMEAFAPYCEFARGVGAYPPVADPIKDTVPARVHVRRWRDKLNVLHLNTALVADGKRKDDQLADVATATDPELWREWYRDDLPAIALGHNSFYDLKKEQRDALAAMFAQRNVSAYLCGDTHLVELDPEKQTINIGPGRMPIPNAVSAKGVADMTDKYSDFGYYWHEWDEGTDRVEARFHRWRGEYLDNTASEGLPVIYCMRRKARPPKPGPNTGSPRSASTKIEGQDPDAELREYLAAVLERKRDGHPSFQLLKVDEIDASLYPKVMEDGETQEYRQIPAQARVPSGEDGDGEGCCPVWDIIRRSWSDGEHRNVVIIGEGGIGKTVALFSIARSPEGMPVPALYIPMYELVDRDGNVRELSDYIRSSYSVYGDSIEKLAARPWEGRPQLLLLLDGFNEVPYALRRKLLHKINDWYGFHPGAQLVAVSRPMDGMNLSQELEGNPIPVTLAPLDEDAIRGYLKKAGRKAPSRNSPIWEDLRYPLFLNLYVKTGRLKGKAPAGYPLHVMESQSGATLIWNYLQRELLRHMKDSSKKAEEWVLRCAVANEYVLPYIAYQMVSAQRMGISFDQVVMWTTQALARLEGDTLPSHLRKIWNTYRRRYLAYPTKSLFSSEEWISTVLQDAGVLVPIGRVHDEEAEQLGGENYAFMHQNFRDCLAGLYLVNCAEAANERVFSGVWCCSQNHSVLKCAAELMNSTILRQLWNANREGHVNSMSGELGRRLATYNLLELCKLNDSLLKGFELDFSGMDLRGLSLMRYLGKDGPALPLFRDRLLSVQSKFSRSVFVGDGHRGLIKCAVALPDGRVASASTDGTVRVWDVATGSCIAILRNRGGSVRCLAALPDGRVASGSDDGAVRVWDVGTGACLRTLTGHQGWVRCLAALPDGRVASGSDDGTVRVWDVGTGACLRVLEGCDGTVRCLAALPDGRVASASVDSILRIWNIEEGGCLVIQARRGGATSCVEVLSERYVISGSADGGLRVWDTETGSKICTLGEYGDVVRCVTAVSNGRIVSGSPNRTVRIWDSDTGLCLNVLKGHLNWVLCVSALPNGHVVSGSADGTLRLWDSDRGTCLHVLKGHGGPVWCATALSDGRVASGSYDRTLRVWDSNTESCLCILNEHRGTVWCVVALTDGRIVSGSGDGTLKVWDVDTGACLRTLAGHQDWVRCLAALPDGRVASGSDDGTVRVWDVGTGACLRTLEVCDGTVMCLAALPDGRVVSGSDDGTLRVWDPSTGECLRALEGHGGRVMCLAALPDGRVASGYNNQSIIVWDLDEGICLQTIESTGIDVSHMDLSEAILTEDVARLLWQNNANISRADYERWVKHRPADRRDGILNTVSAQKDRIPLTTS